MILRNYKIEILPRNGFVLPEHVATIVNCSVSEPSAFNSANPKGLTFTKENGSPLDSHPIFKALFSFVDQVPGAPEIAQVDSLVWAMLTEAGIAPSNVNVKVTFLNMISI
jgi:hypothetical protein